MLLLRETKVVETSSTQFVKNIVALVREYNIGINLVKISSFTCASTYGNKSGEDNFNPIC